mgnify:CR=1 FL=1
MAKRLFSTDKRSETILAYLRAKGENVSAYISNSVVDETLPVYSNLRVDALYLLDYITDGAKDWTGNKLNISAGEDEVQFYTRQTIGRGIAWLKIGHHIKDCAILQDVIGYFNQDSLSGGISINNVPDTVKSDVQKVREKLTEIDAKPTDCHNNLGGLARDVLEHWEKLWDWNGSYDILISVVYCENPIGKIDPFAAIRMLQLMENQFILEAINEKKLI